MVSTYPLVDTYALQVRSSRRRSAELKTKVLAACDEPGASISGIARTRSEPERQSCAQVALRGHVRCSATTAQRSDRACVERLLYGVVVDELTCRSGSAVPVRPIELRMYALRRMPTSAARQRATALESERLRAAVGLRRLYFESGRWRGNFLADGMTASGRPPSDSGSRGTTARRSTAAVADEGQPCAVEPPPLAR